MNQTPSTSPIKLKTFTIGSLESKDELARYQRLASEIESFRNILLNSSGGCLLVTGYRGVGKTSFVNKALLETQEHLEGEEMVVVRLSLARGYSTDKLLRRMIRELYHAVNSSGVADGLDADTYSRLTLAYIRTSQQLKTVFQRGLTEIVAKAHGTQTTGNQGWELAPKVELEKFALSLGSISKGRSQTQLSQQTTSEETKDQRGMELEFLEYDDEIAENDLDGLIDRLTQQPAESVPLPALEPQVPRRVLKRPEAFWRRMPAEARFGPWTIHNYREVSEATAPITPITALQARPHIKLVFVLDEIDKMTLTEAENIFRSLKNLFLKGNAFFVLVSGKEFYYEWLLKRTTEDDVLFGLFTRVYHVPLFDDQEFRTLVDDLLVDRTDTLPSDLMAHLLHRSKGTPREFLRALMANVKWLADGPEVLVADQQGVQVSAQLYPHLVATYSPIGEASRIDPGVKDYLRRNLHHWLDRMMLAVIFDKDAILQPQRWGNPEETPPERTYEVFLARRNKDTFEALVAQLLGAKVLKVERELDERVYYTFADDIRSQLDSIDQSAAGVLYAELEKEQRQLTELLVEASALVDAQDYEKALQLLGRLGDVTAFAGPLQSSPLGAQLETLIMAAKSG